MFNLINELKYYLSCNENEKECVLKFNKFLHSSNNCYSRQNLLAHITAGGFVVDLKGNILLNHHKFSNKWFQFGGHCDGNEDLINVAKREVFEETSNNSFTLFNEHIFDIAIYQVGINLNKNEPQHLHYDVNFLFVANDTSFKISNESYELKWVSIKDAKKLVDANDIAINRMIEKYEKLLFLNKF